MCINITKLNIVFESIEEKVFSKSEIKCAFTQILLLCCSQLGFNFVPR